MNSFENETNSIASSRVPAWLPSNPAKLTGYFPSVAPMRSLMDVRTRSRRNNADSEEQPDLGDPGCSVGQGPSESSDIVDSLNLASDCSPRGEHSVGALLHGTGACKPCAWFWKDQGCHNGLECRHCHMCESGEMKARKRARQLEVRTRRLGTG